MLRSTRQNRRNIYQQFSLQQAQARRVRKTIHLLGAWLALLLGVGYLVAGYWWLGDRVSVAIRTSFIALGVAIAAYRKT